jgi:heterodisulfide reductase subunit A-like polyferredoxin
MSMGLHSFLQTTALPSWFPLSNLQVGQQKLLSMLSMKKDNSGNVIWDEEKEQVESSIISVRMNLLPMTPRTRFRVCVVGGGISGLSCCTEIFRECARERIPIEVVLLEGRNRLGGRLFTDKETFKCEDGHTPFPVDLGASWIHGIELNPLAALAREAGVEFVTSSESVKMFQEGMQEVDREEDERAGVLFDKLLDLAVSAVLTVV